MLIKKSRDSLFDSFPLRKVTGNVIVKKHRCSKDHGMHNGQACTGRDYREITCLIDQPDLPLVVHRSKEMDQIRYSFI